MAHQSEVNHEEEEISRDEAEGAAPGAEAEAPAQGEVVNDPAGAAAAPDDVEALQQELEAARRQAQENLDKAVRAQAEMENLRKRTARDVENAHKYALEKFVAELLPVLDSLELGLDAADSVGGDDEVSSLREGMELTMKKFRDVLEKFGVSVIDPQGEKFDPELHEAMSMQELDGAESNTVISVMQKGYQLNGRLVRPAMVVVAK